MNVKEDKLPHISFAYFDHNKDLKNQLISKLPDLKEKILFAKIALVDVNVKLNNCKILKVFNLGKI